MTDRPENLPPTKERQFIAELLMTAGPRKEKDGELGEDACGLVIRSNACYFWLADGTSESALLEDQKRRIQFSSRRLAQELSSVFRQSTVDHPDLAERLDNSTPVIAELLRSCLTTVLDRWNVHLAETLKSDQGWLDQAFLPEMAPSRDFSTTFLCGGLTRNGNLQAACYGDSPFTARSEEQFTVFRPLNYRFFVRLLKQGSSYLFVSSKEFEIQTIDLTDVSVVVAGTDGAGNVFELIQSQGSTCPFRELRHRINLFRPNTHDDKSLCIISLEDY